MNDAPSQPIDRDGALAGSHEPPIDADPNAAERLSTLDDER
jgi:hypothetical protein